MVLLARPVITLKTVADITVLDANLTPQKYPSNLGINYGFLRLLPKCIIHPMGKPNATKVACYNLNAKEELVGVNNHPAEQAGSREPGTS